VKEGAKPYHVRAFPIPKSREEGLKKAINRLCQLKVLKKVNHSEWAAPAFIIPKKVDLFDSFLILGNLIKELSKNLFLYPKSRILAQVGRLHLWHILGFQSGLLSYQT